LVTNTISRTRASIAAALSGAGFAVAEPFPSCATSWSAPSLGFSSTRAQDPHTAAPSPPSPAHC